MEILRSLISKGFHYRLISLQGIFLPHLYKSLIAHSARTPTSDSMINKPSIKCLRQEYLKWRLTNLLGLNPLQKSKKLCLKNQLPNLNKKSPKLRIMFWIWFQKEDYSQNTTHKLNKHRDLFFIWKIRWLSKSNFSKNQLTYPSNFKTLIISLSLLTQRVSCLLFYPTNISNSNSAILFLIWSKIDMNVR